MDYSRLMMGVGAPDSGGDSGGGSVTPTTKKISAYFAEPNLPQQYTESLGAPFGDRYVYTIFMQGINVLPEIPSSAEGSELTARVKEENGNEYLIMEYYFVKQEGEWVKDGVPKTISEWTKETESSGSGDSVVWLIDDQSVLRIPQSRKSATFTDVQNYLGEGKVVVIKRRNSLDGGDWSDSYTFVDSVECVDGKYRVSSYEAISPTTSLIRQEQH